LLARKFYGKDRTLPLLAFHGDIPAGSFHNLMRNIETQSRPLADWFGRKKWFEYIFHK
jgi:hypothetical protein